MSCLKTVKLNLGKITVKDLEKNWKTPEKICIFHEIKMEINAVKKYSINVSYYKYLYLQVVQGTWMCFSFLFFFCMLSSKVMSNSLWLHGLSPSRPLCPWEFSARILEWVPFPSAGDFLTQGLNRISCRWILYHKSSGHITTTCKF